MPREAGLDAVKMASTKLAKLAPDSNGPDLRDCGHNCHVVCRLPDLAFLLRKPLKTVTVRFNQPR